MGAQRNFSLEGVCVRMSVMTTSPLPTESSLQFHIDHYDVISESPYQRGAVISMVTAFLCYVISNICGRVREYITHSQP